MQQKTGGESSHQEIVPTGIRILKFSICFLEFHFLHGCNPSIFVPRFRRFPKQVKITNPDTRTFRTARVKGAVEPLF
jgi:hypothetical protein